MGPDIGPEAEDIFTNCSDGGLDGVGDLASVDAPGDATVVNHCIDYPGWLEARGCSYVLDSVRPEVDWVEDRVIVAVLGDDLVDLVVLLCEKSGVPVCFVCRSECMRRRLSWCRFLPLVLVYSHERISKKNNAPDRMARAFCKGVRAFCIECL